MHSNSTFHRCTYPVSVTRLRMSDAFAIASTAIDSGPVPESNPRFPQCTWTVFLGPPMYPLANSLPAQPVTILSKLDCCVIARGRVTGSVTVSSLAPTCVRGQRSYLRWELTCFGSAASARWYIASAPGTIIPHVTWVSTGHFVPPYPSNLGQYRTFRRAVVGRYRAATRL